MNEEPNKYNNMKDFDDIIKESDTVQQFDTLSGPKEEIVPEEKPKKKSIKKWIIIGIIAVVIVGVVLFLLLGIKKISCESETIYHSMAMTEKYETKIIFNKMKSFKYTIIFALNDTYISKRAEFIAEVKSKYVKPEATTTFEETDRGVNVIYTGNAEEYKKLFSTEGTDYDYIFTFFKNKSFTCK